MPSKHEGFDPHKVARGEGCEGEREASVRGHQYGTLKCDSPTLYNTHFHLLLIRTRKIWERRNEDKKYLQKEEERGREIFTERGERTRNIYRKRKREDKKYLRRNEDKTYLQEDEERGQEISEKEEERGQEIFAERGYLEKERGEKTINIYRKRRREDKKYF